MSASNPSVRECEVCGEAPATEYPKAPLCTEHLNYYAAAAATTEGNHHA